MVKRIRKRVTKADEELEGTPASQDTETTIDSFDQQMDALAEDGLTTVLSRAAKVIAAQKGLLIAAAVVSIAIVGGLNYYESANTGTRTAAAASFNSASEAYGDALPKQFAQSGLISRALGQVPPKSGEKAPEQDANATAAALQKAAKDFDSTAKNYQDAAIVSMAKLGAASTQYDLGQAKAAAAGYQAIANSPSVLEMAKIVALQGQAAAQENEGNLDGALAAWQTIEGMNKESFGLLAGIQRGRLLEGAGQNAKAIEVYQTLESSYAKALADFRNNPSKTAIKRRLQELGAGAVK
tara:strand:+ start:487 stop:1377 length:891 start_codon:yes stop_codon:yes gene_type:complete